MPRVTVTVSGLPNIQTALSRRSGPQLNATIRKAARAAAAVARPIITSHSPRRTGATAKSVTVRSLRGARVGQGVGASVGPRIWYRHFVIAGTKRGVERNPWVARGIPDAEGPARAAFMAVVSLDIKR